MITYHLNDLKKMHFIYNYNRRNTEEYYEYVAIQDNERRSSKVKNQSRGTQTDYRESETQTIPWEPPYKLPINNKIPEILNLTSLRWGDGLPMGMNEINEVKRMRMEKAWESVLPPLDCKVNVQTHNAIIAMIDKDKWASRERELQLAMDARMELMDEMIKQNNIEKNEKVMERLEKIGKHLNQVRNKEIFQVKRDLNRKLRKLNSKYRSGSRKVISDPMYNKNSMEIKNDFYICKPKLADESLESFKQFYDTLLRKKCDDNFDKPNVSDIYIAKNDGITVKRDNKRREELCIRETRWTDAKLQNLHEDLKNIRLNVTTQKRRNSITMRA